MEAVAPILSSLALLYGVACAHFGNQPGARPWLRWPLTTWDRIMLAVRGLFFEQRPAVETKADHLKIAELEYELFGIKPEPGSSAAAMINARHTFKTDKP